MITTEMSLKHLARTQITKNGFEKIKFYEFEKHVRKKQRLRCDMRFDKNTTYARATPAAAAARVCVLCTLRRYARRHRGALGSACVGRAVRFACGAATRPRAQSTTTFFADRSRLQQKRAAQRAAASACCSSRQSTRRCHR